MNLKANKEKKYIVNWKTTLYLQYVVGNFFQHLSFLSFFSFPLFLATPRLSWFSPVFQPSLSSSRFLSSSPSSFTTAAVTAAMQAGTVKRKMMMPVVAAGRGGASAVSHGCLWRL